MSKVPNVERDVSRLNSSAAGLQNKTCVYSLQGPICFVAANLAWQRPPKRQRVRRVAAVITVPRLRNSSNQRLLDSQVAERSEAAKERSIETTRSIESFTVGQLTKLIVG